MVRASRPLLTTVALIVSLSACKKKDEGSPRSSVGSSVTATNDAGSRDAADPARSIRLRGYEEGTPAQRRVLVSRSGKVIEEVETMDGERLYPVTEKTDVSGILGGVQSEVWTYFDVEPGMETAFGEVADESARKEAPPILLTYSNPPPGTAKVSASIGRGMADLEKAPRAFHVVEAYFNAQGEFPTLAYAKDKAGKVLAYSVAWAKRGQSQLSFSTWTKEWDVIDLVFPDPELVLGVSLFGKHFDVALSARTGGSVFPIPSTVVAEDFELRASARPGKGFGTSVERDAMIARVGADNVVLNPGPGVAMLRIPKGIESGFEVKVGSTAGEFENECVAYVESRVQHMKTNPAEKDPKKARSKRVLQMPQYPSILVKAAKIENDGGRSKVVVSTESSERPGQAERPKAGLIVVQLTWGDHDEHVWKLVGPATKREFIVPELEGKASYYALPKDKKIKVGAAVLSHTKFRTYEAFLKRGLAELEELEAAGEHFCFSKAGAIGF